MRVVRQQYQPEEYRRPFYTHEAQHPEHEKHNPKHKNEHEKTSPNAIIFLRSRVAILVLFLVLPTVLMVHNPEHKKNNPKHQK